MRSRLGVAILVLFVVFAAGTAVVFSWYGFRVVTELGPGSWRQPTEIIDRNGEVFLSLYGREWRMTDPVILEDLPDHIPSAFLAAEDVRFRSHFGIDPVGVARAALKNVRAGGVAQGGSTITQQLAKMHFLSAERTFTRKAVEAVLAVVIEARLSKDEILEAYLNDVYLGHRDGRAILGLDEAARAYFSKAPKSLTVAEAALLAGMIRAPNRDNPDERAKVAGQRRDAVLGVMRDREWITESQHDDAVDDRVRFRNGTLQATPHPYLVAALRSEVAEKEGQRTLRKGGLKIYTAIDGKMQTAAEAAVRGGTQRLRGRYRWLRRKDPLQAAILSIDPSTGGIRALVGGSDFRKSQFDRTRRMRRQPGSALKPFTYAVALARKDITPATIVEDKPVEIQLARNDIWRPQNYDERFRGEVTVREAFEKSLNTPAVRIAGDVGVRRVRGILDDAGIEGELSDTPAVALGVDDVSMRELIGAYTIFPNLGRRTEPHLIEKIENAGGRRIYRFRQRKKQVIEPEVAYVVHTLMRGVVQRGTASDLSSLNLGHVAGKTGTTNDYRDAWFVGYSPDLLTAAWVGFDDGTPLRISSAEAALPIWAAYMVRAPHKRADIAVPDGVSVVAIEPGSGLLWQSGCGVRFEEAFIEGTEPDERCRRRIERPPILIGFEEPRVISPEEAAERATGLPGLDDVQIIIDPGAIPSRPGGDDDSDVLDEDEREEIDRQLEDAMRELERLRREAPRIGTPPIFDPREGRRDERREENKERREERDDRREEKREEKGERKPD
ncbi:MAG TPA: PBP1A family penicillin-binding protein [Thermoanaerobaculia bacterium]|nr:PBP1A family penicillin-binding protein [Thermoanaerobaculia bacterium]